jgi:hypothetical protein
MNKINNNQPKLFREVSVWKRVDDTTVIRYRCFQVVPDGGFFVKSSDFYHYPIDAKQVSQLEQYFLDSLFQDALEEVHDEISGTLEDAIRIHDEAFREE